MPAKSKSSGTTTSKPALNFLVWAVIIVVMLGAIFYCLWRGNSTIGACTTQNLQLTAGQQSGAAGTIYQHMALTNTGKKRCSITGYPTAFLYGSDGYALGSGAAAQPQPAPATIILAAGETAHTVLGYPQAGNFPPGVCSSAKSTSLKLYPPSNSTPLEVALEIAWCPGFSETAMQAGN